MSTSLSANINVAALDKASVALNQIVNKISNKLTVELTKNITNVVKNTNVLNQTINNTAVIMQGSIDKTEKSMSRWDVVKQKFDSVGSAMSNLKTNAINNFNAFSKVAKGITNFGVTAAGPVGKLDALSRKYQINAGSMQVFGALVEGQGGSMEEAASSMGNLKNAMDAASAGGEKQINAFSQLGLSMADLKGLQPHQVMEKIAEASKGADQDLARQAALVALMGDNSKNAISVLTQGADTYRDKYAEMLNNGQLFSDKQLEQASNFDKTWKNMTGTFDGLKTMMGLQVAEKLGPVIDKIQQWVAANRELISTRLGEFLDNLDVDQLGDTITGLLDGVLKLAVAFGSVLNFLGPTNSAFLGIGISMLPTVVSAVKLGTSLYSLGSSIVGLTSGVLPGLMSGLRAVWGVMMANPIMLVMAAVAALVAVIYTNWDSIVEYVSGAWERIKAVFDTSFFAGLVQVVLEIFQGWANGVLGIVKSMIPDSIMPDWLKNAKVTIATDAANSLNKATEAPNPAQKATEAVNTANLADSARQKGSDAGFTAANAAINKAKIEGMISVNITGNTSMATVTASGNVPMSVNTGLQGKGGA